MPMSFPTHQSVVNRATQRGFRAPIENETEEQYRSNFAQFMQLVDPVEASEISSRRGWDQQDPLSVLLGSGLFDKNKPELYQAEIQVLDLSSVPEEIARGIRVETDGGKARLICDYHHGREAESLYGDYSYEEDSRPKISLTTKTVRIIVSPKNCKYPSGLITEERETHYLGGNFICMLDVECLVIDENISTDYQVCVLNAVTSKLKVTALPPKRQQFICVGLPIFSFPSEPVESTDD